MAAENRRPARDEPALDRELADLPAHSDLGDFQALAQRLEEAHQVLVRALESVEKG